MNVEALSFDDLLNQLREDAAAFTESQQFPVPISDILRSIDVSFRVVKTKESEAALILKEDDTFEIVSSKTLSSEDARDRFTLAHELGHILLYYRWGIKSDSLNKNGTYFRIEDICNQFASYLLLPPAIIDGLPSKDPERNLRAIFYLSDYGQTSLEVAARSLAKVDQTIGFIKIQRMFNSKRGGLVWKVTWSCGIFQAELSLNRQKILKDTHDLIGLVELSSEILPMRLSITISSLGLDLFYRKKTGQDIYLISGRTT